ncbi:hypothetical protein [Sporosarcina sp. FA9]
MHWKNNEQLQIWCGAIVRDLKKMNRTQVKYVRLAKTAAFTGQLFLIE